MNHYNQNFWSEIQNLIDKNEIFIDRKKGSTHPTFSDYVYPHDYGHIRNTTANDDMEIDCWVGSKRGSKFDSKDVDALIVTLDSHKQDSEIKVLINCTEDDMEAILECHNRGSMHGMLVKRN